MRDIVWVRGGACDGTLHRVSIGATPSLESARADVGLPTRVTAVAESGSLGAMHHLVVALSLVASALCQEALSPLRTVAMNCDSGLLSNLDPAPRVLWTTDVTVAGDWLQLHFADVNLPPGSQLKIYAPVRPDWVQWHDARSIADYGCYSCQFVGPTLRIELVAGAATTGNRARIDSVAVLDVGTVVDVDTICGTTDDRVLSNDPRSGRLNASCSAWLFSAFAAGTAGHCMTSGTAGKILHFNVPLSTASGTPVPSHPNDQYALSTFLQSLNGGVGADWATMSAVRNSNTQLYPGQAQGSWYSIVPAPPLVAGQQIRVTGYGTGNGTSGSSTWNQVQKTHFGNRQSTATATALRYDTDTTGGNSGSAVLLESTGQMIGVHTHGGCSATSGGKSGTDALRADFTAARLQALALHTIGSITAVGAGCGGLQVPTLLVSGLPEIAMPMSVIATNLHAATPQLGWFANGLSSTTWSGASLPVDMTPLGVEGCLLRVSLDYTESIVSTFGVAGRSYTMPNDPGLVGQHLYFQYFGFSPSATTTLGLVGSNMVDVLLGN